MTGSTAGRVLLTGASGLIGSALLPSLRSSGYEVIRMVRGAAGPEEITWNPTSPPSPEQVSGFRAVIHLAGESIVGRWSPAKKKQIRDSRVLGTHSLVAALTKAPQPPQVLICASAIGYYGSRGEEILREDSAPGNDFLAGVSREWEGETQPAVASGIRVANTRFGIVLSASGGALAKMLTPFRLGVGGKIGSGAQWWSWVSRDDVVNAIQYILEGSISGPVNLVAPNPVTNAEFTKILASVLSRPAMFPMPAFAARLAFGEMADALLLSSARVEPGKLRSAGYRFKYPELQAALSAILRK
jgi:uncharacterized protein